MSIFKGLKWMDRHGTTCTVLILLLLVCATLHYMALANITIVSGTPLANWPTRLVRPMAGIRFFHTNWWFALPYLFLFFGVLVYMEARSIPRWSVWSAFGFLSLPLVGYILTCIRVGVYPV